MSVHRGVVVTVFCVCMLAAQDDRVAADGGHKDGERPIQADQDLDSALDWQSDSAKVVRFLDRQGYALRMIMAAKDGYYAAVAMRDSSTAFLVLIGSNGDSLLFLEDPQELTYRYGPDEVEWLTLQGNQVDAVRITFDNSVEGLIGTTVDGISKNRLVPIYRDGSDGCKAAELVDVDGDGTLELLSYHEDPSKPYCGDSCEFELRERFGMPAGWVRVDKWDGGRWTPAESEYPQFYRELADRYRRMIDWLREQHGEYPCGMVFWTRDLTVYEAWAARASELASGGR
jgi:hypothetical protein